jgi:D-alanyl-D-alanine carboxypeptidase/D-alanyl-D-alanine-endopeptidase (penicillin-binding protein 4)
MLGRRVFLRVHGSRWAAALAAALVGCDPAPKDMSFGTALARPDEPAEAAVLTVRRIPERVLAAPRALLAGRLRALSGELARLREAIAPPPEAPAQFDVAGLDAEIGRIVASLERRADVSVHVRDLRADFVLYDRRGDAPLNPASNHKLLTASAALDLLGEEFRFETRALALDGALYLVGEGDPTLDTQGLRTLADDLARAVDPATLTRVVVDDLAFSPRRLAPGFADDGVGVSYQAPSGALSLEFNTVVVTVTAPKTRARPKEVVPLEVVLSPPSTHLRLDHQGSVGRAPLTVRTYAIDEDGETRTVVEVRGQLRPGRAQTLRRRVGDPGLYTGGALAVMLAERTGGPPPPVSRGPAPAAGPVRVAVRESPPLKDVARAALTWSNNFIAEQLLRTLGARMTGEPGDWDNGAEVVLAYWQALGLPANALVFENGSGLSDRGRVTTTALVDLIAVAHRVHGPGGLLSALPVAGEEGTMRARLRRSGKRVRAKTGTMDGISGLSGVITAEDGAPQVAFSILINVREGSAAAAAKRRAAADRIVLAVLRAVDQWEVDRAAP